MRGAKRKGIKMGMYTEIHLFVNLKKDTPEHIIDILKNITTDSVVSTKLENIKIPDDDFFKSERWDFAFRCDSYYFPGITYSVVEKPESWCDWYSLNINSNHKNYDSEIEKFLKWIHQYVDETDCETVGYFRYEEDDLPTVIYYTKNGFELINVKRNKNNY